jgi:cobalamin biosynthesis protein CobD/CbiB
MKSPDSEALMSIISGMKSLQLEKVKGFKNKKDEDPSIEIEEADEDEEDED